jgi:hemolysin D
MQIDDKMVNLEPGMAVRAEIKTGQRRVIEYLMSPLLRYKQDALKER